MMQKTNEKPSAQQPQTQIKEAQKPNEAGVLNIDEHVRIFDPNTKETFLEKRI